MKQIFEEEEAKYRRNLSSFLIACGGSTLLKFMKNIFCSFLVRKNLELDEIKISFFN